MRVMPYSIMGAVACMFVYGYVEFMWVLIAISAFHAMFDAFTLPAGQLAVAVSAPPIRLPRLKGSMVRWVWRSPGVPHWPPGRSMRPGVPKFSSPARR